MFIMPDAYGMFWEEKIEIERYDNFFVTDANKYLPVFLIIYFIRFIRYSFGKVKPK